MTLDLLALSRQVEEAALPLQDAERARESSLSRALSVFSHWQGTVDALRAKVDGCGAHMTFRVPRLRQEWGEVIGPPGLPEDYGVIAVDGSQIDRDRHAGLDCALINIGTAALWYGERSHADLSSQPLLLCKENDLYLADPENKDNREPIEGALLHAKRSVLECGRLAELSQVLSEEGPLLCLVDNSLVLWGLMGRRFETYVRRALLEEYGVHLRRFRELAQAGKRVALVGYVSKSDSSQVVNLLRLADCQDPDCRNCEERYPRRQQSCHELGRLRDRDLFAAVLSTPGSRSALFDDPVSTGENAISPVEVSFFYLNTGEEIARAEVPGWVADDPALLQFAHATLWSQARLGFGYPVALTEAHEQAVVSVADREQFWSLIESTSYTHRLPYAPSIKSQGKRLRAL